MTSVCLYASLLLESTREISESRSFVRRISIGDIGVPGDEKTLNDVMRDVASINSFSFVTDSEGFGTLRLVTPVNHRT